MNMPTNGLSSYDLYDFDFLMNDDTVNNTSNTFTGDSGLNLGFDAHHDWSDGGSQQLPDIFGGFFFGPLAGVDGMPEGGFHTTEFGDAGSNNEHDNMWLGGQD